MGAQRFSVLKVGRFTSEHEAFQAAQREADDEYGHQQGYSGEINSVNSYTCLTTGVPKFGTDEFWDWVEDYDMYKGDCFCVDVTTNITAAKRAEVKIQNNYYKKQKVLMYFFFGEARV